LALEQAPELGGVAYPEAIRLVGSYDDAEEIVVSGPRRVDALGIVAGGVMERLPATGARFEEEMSKQATASALPLLHSASDSVADLTGEGAPWCRGAARAACVDRALSLTRKIEKVDPAQCDGYALEAQALDAAGETAQAMDLLEHTADSVTDRVACLRALVGLAVRSDDPRRLDEALDAIVRAGCTDETQCVGNLVWVAQTHEGRGNLGRAMALYKRAYEKSPEEDALLEAIARLAGKTGLNAEALEHYQELARRHPGEARWQTAAQEQRDALLRGVLKL
jgi:tetratricopeptide (TPR) repeat protein